MIQKRKMFSLTTKAIQNFLCIQLSVVAIWLLSLQIFWWKSVNLQRVSYSGWKQPPLLLTQTTFCFLIRRQMTWGTWIANGTKSTYFMSRKGVIHTISGKPSANRSHTILSPDNIIPMEQTSCFGGLSLTYEVICTKKWIWKNLIMFSNVMLFLLYL